MNKVIFVDIDGVFHGPGYANVDYATGKLVISGEMLFVWAPVLWRLIEPFAVDIVVHSSWRRYFEVEQILGYFPAAMRHRVLGTTAPLLRRHESIVDYVSRNRIEEFIVLDDMPESFPEDWEPLIVCDSSRGLADAEVQQRILNFLTGRTGETWRNFPLCPSCGRVSAEGLVRGGLTDAPHLYVGMCCRCDREEAWSHRRFIDMCESQRGISEARYLKLRESIRARSDHWQQVVTGLVRGVSRNSAESDRWTKRVMAASEAHHAWRGLLVDIDSIWARLHCDEPDAFRGLRTLRLAEDLQRAGGVAS